MDWMPKLRMSGVLAEQKDKFGSFVRLEQEIERVSEIRVDRRKLARIVRGMPLSLSLEELAGLDAFLARLGHGLAETPLFEGPHILPSLVSRDALLFFVGSFPGSESVRADLSLWDVRAMMAIQEGIDELGSKTRVQLQDVVFEKKLPSPDARIDRPELFDRRRSICCLGTPRACWAAEHILALMFNVVAFKGDARTLPLYFLWADRLSNADRPSTFSRPIAELKDFELSYDAKNGRALIVDGTPYVSRPLRPRSSKWVDYGVIAAQQRKTGQAHAVMAGLSAPATYGTARAAVTQRTGTLPPASEDQHGPIRVAVVEVTIGQAKDRDYGDTRRVEKTEVVHSKLYEPLPDAA